MDALIPEFIKQGMVGLVFAMLVLWIALLYRRIDQLEKREQGLIGQLMSSAEKRISDNRESNDVIRGNMTALASLTEAFRGVEKSVLQMMMRGKR